MPSRTKLMHNVITGASGQLGNQIAEQLVAQGETVRAIVRPNANVSFLQKLNVEIVACDYADSQALEQAVTGAKIVYHCAARVSDWGPWYVFKGEIVDVAARVLEAC